MSDVKKFWVFSVIHVFLTCGLIAAVAFLILDRNASSRHDPASGTVDVSALRQDVLRELREEFAKKKDSSPQNLRTPPDTQKPDTQKPDTQKKEEKVEGTFLTKAEFPGLLKQELRAFLDEEAKRQPKVAPLSEEYVKQLIQTEVAMANAKSREKLDMDVVLAARELKEKRLSLAGKITKLIEQSSEEKSVFASQKGFESFLKQLEIARDAAKQCGAAKTSAELLKAAPSLAESLSIAAKALGDPQVIGPSKLRGDLGKGLSELQAFVGFLSAAAP